MFSYWHTRVPTSGASLRAPESAGPGTRGRAASVSRRDDALAGVRVERRAVAVGRELEAARLEVRQAVDLLGEVHPGRHRAAGAKRSSPGGGPKKKTSWRVGKMRSPRRSGNTFGSQGPQAKTNVPAAISAPSAVRTTATRPRRRGGERRRCDTPRRHAPLRARPPAPRGAPSARRSPARRCPTRRRRARTAGSVRGSPSHRALRAERLRARAWRACRRCKGRRCARARGRRWRGRSTRGFRRRDAARRRANAATCACRARQDRSPCG